MAAPWPRFGVVEWMASPMQMTFWLRHIFAGALSMTGRAMMPWVGVVWMSSLIWLCQPWNCWASFSLSLCSKLTRDSWMTAYQ